MPVLAAATTPAQVDGVSRTVHEWWFEPSRLTQRPDGELQIPLTLATGSDVLIPTRWLRIRHVKAYRLVPISAVPAYDIDCLAYQPDEHHLRIRTGIPLDFGVEVESLDIDVVEPSGG